MNAQVHESSKWRKRKTNFPDADRTPCKNAHCYEAVKSNLPSEHNRMHKFTKVVSGEREKQSSYH